MKAHSSHGIYDAKLARERRKERNPRPCNAYLKSDGTWQLEQDELFCRELCISEGTLQFRSWEGSLEDYMDGKHYLVIHV